MAQGHEYAVLGGTNRSTVGRYIGIAAASISSLAVFTVLTLLDVARSFGGPQHLPPTVMSAFGAGVVYLALYWLFDKHVWRLPILAGVLKVPNLAGTWTCRGQAVKPDGTYGASWHGTMTIVQSWDRVRVRVKTRESGSNSVSAALTHDDIDGFRLLYSYVNEPNIDQTDMKAHRGFAEVIFAPNLKTAEGSYFNGQGRYTFGTIEISKENR